MNNLKILLQYKKKQHEIKMWNHIFNIGWGITSINTKYLKNYIKDNYTPKQIEQLKRFVKFKRKELQKILKEYEQKNNLTNYFQVSDGGFWDLTAHIVGLGKERYYSVINNPEIAREISLNYMYKENFEYIFN